MLVKEYRICMPLTVDEYRIGQLYMISKHSCEQSGGGEGVEVVRNEPDVHPQHGPGQLTEKRIYLSSKLPSWAKALAPRFFYVTEKAWNFYPYTITEYSVSFLPKFSIRIETRFENNNGDNDNVFGDSPTPADSVCFLDILSDPIPEKHYRESEDLSHWRSTKTGRGPLEDGWRGDQEPVMCSYKRVQCSFEVYGFQTRTEEFIHRNIRDILLVGHRQAVAWIDEWHGLSLEEVREYEQEMQEKTNSKVKSSHSSSAVWSLKCKKMVKNVARSKYIQFTAVEKDRNQKTFQELQTEFMSCTLLDLGPAAAPYKYPDGFGASVGEKWEEKSSQEAFHNTRSSEEAESEGACPERRDRCGAAVGRGRGRIMK